MSVPLQVWRANPILWYDPFFADNEYRGERGACDIEPIAVPASSMSAGEYSLVSDSGWIVTMKVAGNPNAVPHGDGLRVFADFYIALGQDSVIPVFQFPRLIEQQEDFSYGWRGVLAFAAASGGGLFPSIWMNTRQLEWEIAGAPAVSKPCSTLAHEMAHILLDPMNPPGVNPPPWGDNSTPFLHIETHIGWSRHTRTGVAGPGPVTLVTANDLNRRNLISQALDDACFAARFQIRFVRPVLPP